MTMTGTPTRAPGPLATMEPRRPRRTVPMWVAIVGFGLAVVFLATAVVLFAQRRDAISSRDAARAQVVTLQSVRGGPATQTVARQHGYIARLEGTVHACRLNGTAESYFHAYGVWPPNYSEIKTIERCYGTAVPIIPWPVP